ncbi:MAG: (2Fe-2S)-binding protein [Bryobacteraceae bacterium]
MAKVSLNVNGKARTLDIDPTTPLLYILRNDLELNGPRFGCGLAQCGACTVIVDGKAVRSCVTPARTVEKKAITTLEGLGTSAKPHPLQQAFIDEQAVQCGFCINGIVMNAKVLLDKNPNPTIDQIKEHMDPILCRCGTHPRMIKAIQRAATTMKPAKAKA